jgi:hypothetical protein
MASIEHIIEKLKKTNLTKIFFTDLNGRIMNLPINPRNMTVVCRVTTPSPPNTCTKG